MSLRRALGSFDATTVVVGGIIGAGIVINPSLVASGKDAEPFVQELMKRHGVAVVPGSFFGSPAHFRISLEEARLRNCGTLWSA